MTSDELGLQYLGFLNNILDDNTNQTNELNELNPIRLSSYFIFRLGCIYSFM